MMFHQLIFTVLLREGFSHRVMGMVENMASNSGQGSSSAMYYSHLLIASGKGTPHAMQGLKEVALCSRVKDKSKWEASFVESTQRCPSSPGRVRLARLNHSMGWLGNETHYSETSRTCAGPLDVEGCLDRGPYPQEKNGEGSLQLCHWRLFQFHQMSSQHMILGHNFRPCTTYDNMKEQIKARNIIGNHIQK